MDQPTSGSSNRALPLEETASSLKITATRSWTTTQKAFNPASFKSTSNDLYFSTQLRSLVANSISDSGSSFAASTLWKYTCSRTVTFASVLRSTTSATSIIWRVTSQITHSTRTTSNQLRTLSWTTIASKICFWGNAEWTIRRLSGPKWRRLWWIASELGSSISMIMGRDVSLCWGMIFCWMRHAILGCWRSTWVQLVRNGPPGWRSIWWLWAKACWRSCCLARAWKREQEQEDNTKQKGSIWVRTQGTPQLGNQKGMKDRTQDKVCSWEESEQIPVKNHHFLLRNSVSSSKKDK